MLHATVTIGTGFGSSFELQGNKFSRTECEGGPAVSSELELIPPSVSGLIARASNGAVDTIPSFQAPGSFFGAGLRTARIFISFGLLGHTSILRILPDGKPASLVASITGLSMHLQVVRGGLRKVPINLRGSARGTGCVASHVCWSPGPRSKFFSARRASSHPVYANHKTPRRINLALD